MFNIRTPQDILKFMDNIEYGYIDLLGEKHINNLKGFRTNYRTLNIEQIPVIGVEGELIGLVRASDLIKALVD